MHARIPIVFTAAAVAAAAAPAQINATLLSRIDNKISYAGVWGYESPGGREFALVGVREGTWVVETTDPGNPVERGLIAEPVTFNGLWREVTSHGNYVYSVSEGHGGMRVIDMANPSSPVDLGYSHKQDWGNAHSISIDPATGYLYVNGCGRPMSGMHILDTNANPADPPILATFTLQYVHDSHIRDGVAYLSEINRGYLRILDVSNLGNINNAGATISRFLTPNQFTHNSWVSADRNLLLTTDETQTPPGRVTAYDISNPQSPQQRGTYGATGHIAHNVFLIGRTGYIAHYTDGFHMIDLADPNAITQVAYHDTSTKPNPDWEGAWGCYPFQDSGIVYVSDFDEGLYVLQIEAGHFNRYGAATPSSTGSIPRMSPEGATPRVGAAKFEIVLNGLAANGRYAVLFSVGQASRRILGVDVHVDLNQLIASVDGTANSNGTAVMPVAVPNDAALGGKRVYCQVIAIDPAGPQGLTASRGTWFGIAQ